MKAASTSPVRCFFRSLTLCVALGSAVAGACFIFNWKVRPSYTARIPFQVSAPLLALASSPQQTVPPDDTGIIIHRQAFLFQQDSVLKAVLQSDEFHKLKDTGMPPQWVTENQNDLLHAARRDLHLLLHDDSPFFELTMTTRNPAQATALVQAAARVYKDFIHEQGVNRKAADAKNAAEVLQQMEQTFAVKNAEWEELAKRKGIDGLRTRLDIERSALLTLERQYTEADSLAVAAESQNAVIKKANSDGRQIELSPDMQQSIENNGTLRSLGATLLELQQELSAERSKSNVSLSRVGGMEARLDTINTQIVSARSGLIADARKRMLDLYATEATNRRDLANYIGGVRQSKEQLVKSLSQDLAQYEQKIEAIKEQQTLLNKVRNQYALASAARLTDDMRIEQLTDAAVTPDNPDLPAWRPYGVFGPGGGLLLGTLVGLGKFPRRNRNSPPPERKA